MTDQPIDVLLSHAPDGAAWARTLAERIATASKDRSRGPWRVVALEDADGDGAHPRIDTCRSFVVVLSPAYMASYEERGPAYHHYGAAVHREFKGGRGLIFQVLRQPAELVAAMETRPIHDLSQVAADDLDGASAFLDLLSDLEHALGVRPTAVLERGEIVRRDSATGGNRCDVILVSSAKTVQTIGVIRKVFDLDLTESRALIGTPPSTIARGVSQSRAEEIRAAFDGSGAEVRIQVKGGYDITLNAIGSNRVETANRIKEVLDISLAEARTRMASLPCLLAAGATRQKAYEIIAALEPIGARVVVEDRFLG